MLSDKKKNRLKIAHQVSKLAFRPIVIDSQSYIIESEIQFSLSWSLSQVQSVTKLRQFLLENRRGYVNAAG